MSETIQAAAQTTPAGQDAATVKRLRLGVGSIAGALPFLVLFGNMAFAHAWVFLGSISGSYYTDMRGVFVGSMCATGTLLICYRYERIDNICSNLAGIMAVIVALFPTTPGSPAPVTHTQTVIGVVHYTAATLLFVLLAYFCLGLFPRTVGGSTVFFGLFARSTGTEQPRKRRRNRIYRVCGWLIVVSIVAAGVIAVTVPTADRDSWNTLFWCETVAVMSFAAAWLTKGGFFFWCNDADDEPVSDPAAAGRVPDQLQPGVHTGDVDQIAHPPLHGPGADV